MYIYIYREKIEETFPVLTVLRKLQYNDDLQPELNLALLVSKSAAVCLEIKITTREVKNCQALDVKDVECILYLNLQSH